MPKSDHYFFILLISANVTNRSVRLFNMCMILQTLGPFNVFILLNGWICLHGVLVPALSWFLNAL